MNFDDMYKHVEDVMVQSKIARRLEQPKFMDIDGNEVDSESEAVGCKVQVELTHPDMALVLDEVGCNTSQECDNAIGGKLFLTGKNDQPYRSVSSRHSHFTVLGVTALSGEPVLCVVIISGKKADIPVATGVDWKAFTSNLHADFDDGDEIKFLKNHRGSGNIFPEGPVCQFRGKKVPSFVTFTESGGMDGNVLTEVFKHLDAFGIYEDERKKD